MTNLYPSNKHNPCPVCENDDGDCRHSKADENFQLCHTFADARKGERVNGFICVKESNGHTASFKPDNSTEWTEERRREWADEKKRRRERSEREEQQKLAQLLPIPDRDEQYRRIVATLGLNQKHRHSELSEKRGLNSEEIDFAVSQGWITSWKPGLKVDASPSLAGVMLANGTTQLTGVIGLAIAAVNLNSEITGFQIASDNRVKFGKYIWLSSANKGGNSPHLPSGELPVFLWRHPEAEQITETWLVEGSLKSLITALKLWFRYGRKDIQIVGAAGANWLGSINAVVEALGQTNKVVLCPDAGSLSNSHILNNYKKITEELTSRTYSVNVAWWNQLEKNQDPDIDELENTLSFDLITPENFLLLVKEHEVEKNETETVDGKIIIEHPDQHPEHIYSTESGTDFKSPIPVDPGKLPRWVASRMYTADLTVENEKVDFKLFPREDNQITTISASKGGGKSESARDEKLERQIIDGIYSITILPRRKLVAQEIAEMRKMGMVVENFSKFDRSTTIPENTHLVGCTESLPKIEGYCYKYDLYFDEKTASDRQLVSGGTVKGAERAKLQEIISSELRAAKRVYIMDDDLADHDIEMLKKIAPNKKVVAVRFETIKRLRDFKFLDGISTDKDGEIDLKKANQSALLNLIIEPESKLFIVTDTQGTKIEKLLNHHSKVGFLINSEISANYRLPDGSLCEGETWKHLFNRVPLALERYGNLISIDKLNSSWVSEMMQDPSEFILKYQPDFVLGSPSIMTGFSVKLQKYFNCIAGIFCGLLRTQGLSQFLFRLRDNDIPTYISIPEKGLFSDKDDYYYEDLGKLINERMTELAAEFGNPDAEDIILNAQKRINSTWQDRSLLEKGLELFEKNHYRSCLRYVLEKEGHTVEFVTSITRPDIAQNMKDIAIEEKIQKASEIFNANEYVDGLEEAKQVHERLETVDTARALTKARILDKLPGIKDTSIWSEDFILECYLKNRNFIKQQENFYFVHNPEMSKKRLEAALYNTATAEFVDGESLVQKDYHVIKALQALGIPELIKQLENGLELTKKSPEVLKIIAKARRTDIKTYRLAGLIPENKTVEQKENVKFIKQLLGLAGVYLKSNGQTNTKGGKYYVYGLDFDKFNSDYRTVALDCVNIRWNTWEAENYQTDKPNWEYTLETGQRAPKALSMPETELACDPTSLEPVTAVATAQETVIENLPAMEPNIMDKVKEMVLFGFTPAIKAIAKQIKEFGQASEKALATLTEIELLALQEAVLEMSTT
ncbi:hypothetical protein [Nostoc sp. CHAB 5715]|uniref:hypothetical protein n=1 Tax=Nostoc sp. CHAB 5715 TaxID=2780400 RepID=UPI001E562292|nr:hypothetical protein [Nostoc sp. CHAB 5715]MCC5620801.1 hypothetical protein [Nostoc sp. CHAB 5715]